MTAAVCVRERARVCDNSSLCKLNPEGQTVAQFVALWPQFETRRDQMLLQNIVSLRWRMAGSTRTISSTFLASWLQKWS